MPIAVTSHPRSRGFTLIEVMITVAIIAILASVAVPSYKDYIRRGQQPEAFNALSDFRAKMEQYYQDNRKYGTGTSTTCAPDSTASTWNGFTATARFSYSCTTDGATQQSYSLVATGTAGQVNGDKYTIDQNGNRRTTKFKGASVSQDCWLTNSSTC